MLYFLMNVRAVKDKEQDQIKMHGWEDEMPHVIREEKERYTIFITFTFYVTFFIY